MNTSGSPPGVYGYFGVTTSGKTTLALLHAAADLEAEGRPLAVLDCMPARNLRYMAHEPNLDAVIDALYEEGRKAVWTPRSDEELARFFDAVHRAGTAPGRPQPIDVLWDEAGLAQSPHHIDPRIATALRGWQHSDCRFRLVSQSPGDFNGVFFKCLPECYVFRLERDIDLARIEQELKLPREQVENQGQGQYLTYSRDRFRKVAP